MLPACKSVRNLDGRVIAEVENAPHLESAMVWLREMFGTGTATAKFLQDMAQQVGHTLATVRRAKKMLGIVSIKDGKGGWLWRMPKTLTPEEDAHHKNDERLPLALRQVIEEPHQPVEHVYFVDDGFTPSLYH